MTVKVLPAELAQRAVRGALDARAAFATVVPHDVREMLVRTLTRALTVPAALDEYLVILEGERARSGLPPANPSRPGSLSTADIARTGIGALDDTSLLAVATTPDALRQLQSELEHAMLAGEVGESWWREYDLIADELPPEYLSGSGTRRVVEEILEIERGPNTSSHRGDESSPIRLRRSAAWWTSGIAALAASLLLGVFLGSQLGGRNKQQEFALANVEARGDPGRGIEDVELIVTNSGDARAFVTIVGLFPENKRAVVYNRRAGETTFLSVGPHATAGIKNLPPEFEGASTALVVLTNVPSGEAVRVSLPSTATPEQAGDLAERLRVALDALGVRSEIRVASLPIAKR